MADYAFYTGTYLGGSIPADDFPRLAKRSGEQLAKYKRLYTVTAPETNSEDMATCAIADAMYYFETAQNTPQSSSIGSVSSSNKSVDISPAAQAKELFLCACLYLDICRGVG